jgi:hypothetical protein
MAYRYGAQSRAVQATAHPLLREIFETVLTRHDHALTDGVRLREEQQRLFNKGRTQIRGDSDYDHMPREPGGLSWALDVKPWVGGKELVVPEPDAIQRICKAGDAIAFLEAMRRAYLQWGRFAGLVFEVAAPLIHAHNLQHPDAKLRLVSGMDWNGNLNIMETGFLDAPHWVLREAP